MQDITVTSRAAPATYAPIPIPATQTAADVLQVLHLPRKSRRRPRDPGRRQLSADLYDGAPGAAHATQNATDVVSQVPYPYLLTLEEMQLQNSIENYAAMRCGRAALHRGPAGAAMHRR